MVARASRPRVFVTTAANGSVALHRGRCSPTAGGTDAGAVPPDPLAPFRGDRPTFLCRQPELLVRRH